MKCRKRVYKARKTENLKHGLVLRRKVGEQIHIGPDITVTLLATEGPYGQIHIHAPREIAIYRPEAETKSTRKITARSR